MFSIDIALRWYKKKNIQVQTHRTHRLNLIKWWFRLWWDREAVRFHEIPPAASSRTGGLGDDITVPWWPWKEPIMCPCPIQLAAISLQAHCRFFHFHPSIPQEERELPLRLASFGPGSWNREPFIGHSPSPKGYIRIPTPRWTGSANRFGMMRDS